MMLPALVVRSLCDAIIHCIFQGIGVSPASGRSPHNTAAKTSVILNGTGRKADLQPEADMETEEEEEEEEDNSSLGETTTPDPASPGSEQHYQQKPGQRVRAVMGREGRGPEHHLQEPQTGSQFPMSGDLPSIDPGLPSPSLGFDLAEVRFFCNMLG